MNEENQVTGVRSSIFYPLRGNDDVVTAQIVWDALNPQPAGYQVRVFSTGLSSGCRIMVSVLATELVRK